MCSDQAELSHDPIGDLARGELICSDGSHEWSIDGLGLFDRVNEGIESQGVRFALHARCSGRQPVHDDSHLAMPDERRAGAHANRRAAGQENFLQSQRTVVVVRQVGAGPRSSSGLE